MNRRIMLALGSATLLIVSACGGGATGTAPAASQPPASEAPAGSASAGAGDTACAPSTDAGTVEAGMADIAFAPATITASVGDVIAWTNGDSAPHTATVQSDPTCTTDTLANGQTGGIVFNVAGEYALICKIHSSMTGTIEITG